MSNPMQNVAWLRKELLDRTARAERAEASNARLVASNARLVEALEGLLNTYGLRDRGLTLRAHQTARAAIAEAK